MTSSFAHLNLILINVLLSCSGFFNISPSLLGMSTIPIDQSKWNHHSKVDCANSFIFNEGVNKISMNSSEIAYQNISANASSLINTSNYQIIVFKSARKLLNNTATFRAKGDINETVNLQKIHHPSLRKTRCKVWLMKKSNFRANQKAESTMAHRDDLSAEETNDANFEIYITVSNENNGPSFLLSINDILNLLIASCAKKKLKKVIALIIVAIIYTTVITFDLGQNFALKTTKLLNSEGTTSITFELL